jgi:hypothetical protein
MRKKRIPPVEPIIAGEILAKAREAVHPDKLPRVAKCEVCGSDCAVNPAEQLCWVCRRLKISAWHESEQQMPIQE